ncbi:MAG: hypothetical protein ACI8Y4_003839 [Candidatus Poriferisodalaceae bacterium]|jgi:hypothetical protein
MCHSFTMTIYLHRICCDFGGHTVTSVTNPAADSLDVVGHERLTPGLEPPEFAGKFQGTHRSVTAHCCPVSKFALRKRRFERGYPIAVGCYVSTQLDESGAHASQSARPAVKKTPDADLGAPSIAASSPSTSLAHEDPR